MYRIRALTSKINPSYLKIGLAIWTWVIPVIILAVIGLKMYTSGEGFIFTHFSNTFKWLYFSPVIFLLPLNVLLESWKWKLVLNPIEKISIGRAVKVILSGRSLNVISPFGLGDAVSKWGFSQMKAKVPMLAAISIARITQMLPTLLGGILAIGYLVRSGFLFDSLDFVYIVAFICLVTMSLICVSYYFRKQLQTVYKVFANQHWSYLVQCLGVSSLRYALFSVQFLLVFLALGSTISIITLSLGISWIFLVKSLVPTLSVLGDLVKREISAVMFFSFFAMDLNQVMIASLIIWLVNIVVPAVVGVFFVSQIKPSS